MQPYFLPYIGYFQLIGAVDEFIVYDNIKYTKKGWINRNRYLSNGGAATFTLPLRKAPDHLDILARRIADDFNRTKLLSQLREAYRKAPHFDATYPLLEDVANSQAIGLFDFLLDGLRLTCRHLGLTTTIRASSQVAADHSLHGQERVIAIAKATGADCYINPIGGTELYSRADFAAAGLDLHFLRPCPPDYAQFGAAFVPSLSIIDVLMFNGAEQTGTLLQDYDLV